MRVPLWPAIACGLVAVAAGRALRKHRRRRQRATICQNCGYSKAGLTKSTKCPECGLS